MTVKRIEEAGTCLLCNKQKEVAVVQMDGQSEVLLCWADVRRMALMKMRMTGMSRPATSADSSSPARVGPTITGNQAGK